MVGKNVLHCIARHPIYQSIEEGFRMGPVKQNKKKKKPPTYLLVEQRLALLHAPELLPERRDGGVQPVRLLGGHAQVCGDCDVGMVGAVQGVQGVSPE